MTETYLADVVYDQAAELAVLAACLDSDLARQNARKILVGSDFYHPAHEAIWDALSRLERHDKAIAPVTLSATLTGNAQALALLPDLVTTFTPADAVTSHAEIVRGWSLKRQLWREATRTAQQAMKPDLNAATFAAAVATRFATIRDTGLPDTTSAVTLGELLAEPDDEPDWLLPGLLERRDRLMLTGIEGGGKSYLLRQIAVCAAAGLDPFDSTRVKPLTTTIIDAENTDRQVKRKARPIAQWAERYGQAPYERVVIDCRPRMDITTDRSLAEIHQLLDATQPDMVVIGPLYRLVPRALQSDDEAAPVLAALDTIRDRGIALLIEAHAGHSIGEGGKRAMRPRGSSALLGWPEFGYGFVPDGDTVSNLVPWRGDRDERAWPDCLRRDRHSPRWVPVDVNWRDVAAS